MNCLVAEEVKTLNNKNLTIFALSGGIITKTYTYEGVREEEFENFQPYIVKNNDTKTCEGGVCGEKGWFQIILSIHCDKYIKRRNKMYGRL